MICQNDISNLKEELHRNIGQKIMIRGAIGRKRYFEEKAIIENTYPDIFRVKNEGKSINSCYKYKDILANELEVSIFNGTEYYPLVPTIINTKL